MMTTHKRYRSLRRKEYWLAIEQLRQRHPWLAQQIVEPPPGHLRVLGHFLSQCELVMRDADRHGPLFLCATTVRDKLLLTFELDDASLQREQAILDVTAQARDAAQLSCPICGAPALVSDLDAARGQRCMQHMGVNGLFAEDVRRHRHMVSHQGTGGTSFVIGSRSDDVPADRPKVENHHDDQRAVGHLLCATPTATRPDLLPPEPMVTVLALAGLKRFVDRHRPKGDDRLKRAQAMVERIVIAGHERRKLGTLPDGWSALLEGFAHDFPNFYELAELLRDHFALSMMGDRRVEWPPILLVGPAGIGKTEVARWLAERLSLPFRVLDMASAQSGSPLAGSEAFWSNSEPGMLFELLAYQSKANPVFVLDELDKVDQQKPYDPMAPLYTLLEPRSARSFTDLSIRDFSIDASHVNWIATANSLESIPPALRSRLTVLNIKAPTELQTERIAQSIYSRLCEEASWGNAFEALLDRPVLAVLQKLPPRILALTIRRALGAAARDGRRHIKVQDLRVMSSSESQGIGFLAGQGA